MPNLVQDHFTFIHWHTRNTTKTKIKTKMGICAKVKGKRRPMDWLLKLNMHTQKSPNRISEPRRDGYSPHVSRSMIASN